MTEVVTLGECMGVLYPEQPVTLDAATTLTLDIGGAEANLAIRLSRLGHTTRFISRVGDDPFGRRIRATLAANAVDTSCLITGFLAVTLRKVKSPHQGHVAWCFFWRQRVTRSHAGRCQGVCSWLIWIAVTRRPIGGVGVTSAAPQSLVLAMDSI